jgi:hypothetical protein
MFLRNIGWNSTEYTASYPKRWYLQKFGCPARVYCPPATGPCAVPFTRWQLLDCEVVGERQWPVKTKMLEFTGMASCCPTGLSSYWLMCLHRDGTWHPVTGHLNWPANWHRVNGPFVLCEGILRMIAVHCLYIYEQKHPFFAWDAYNSIQ